MYYQSENCFVHVREIGLSSAAMHELQQCVFRGGKRVRAAMQWCISEWGTQIFEFFLDFIHVCQLSSQIAQIAPDS